MERLTSYKSECKREMICRYEDCDTCKENCPHINEDNCPCLQKILEKLAEYEDLEEQGKLLKLPCKVWDTYFEIETAFWRDREKCKRCGFYHEGSDVFRDDDSCFFEEEYNRLPGCVEIAVKTFNDVKEIISCMEDGSVGETVFFVQEEAEAKLKELRTSKQT